MRQKKHESGKVEGVIVCTAFVLLGGAVLAAPFYGLSPVLIVSGGLLTAAWVIRELGVHSPR